MRTASAAPAKAGSMMWSCWLELDDGHIGHAPVDEYRPNPWGPSGASGHAPHAPCSGPSHEDLVQQTAPG